GCEPLGRRFPGVSLEDSLHAPATGDQPFGLKKGVGLARGLQITGVRSTARGNPALLVVNFVVGGGRLPVSSVRTPDATSGADDNTVEAWQWIAVRGLPPRQPRPE